MPWGVYLNPKERELLKKMARHNDSPKTPYGLKEQAEKLAYAQQEAGDLCTASPAPSSLLDRLKMKRVNLQREMNGRLKELDRQIYRLEDTDAETIVRESENLLYRE